MLVPFNDTKTTHHFLALSRHGGAVREQAAYCPGAAPTHPGGGGAAPEGHHPGPRPAPVVSEEPLRTQTQVRRGGDHIPRREGHVGAAGSRGERHSILVCLFSFIDFLLLKFY